MVGKKSIVEEPKSILASENLSQIANCLAFLALQTDSLKNKDKKDLIPILISWGFDRNSIASLLITTPETVSVRMSEIKAEKKKKSDDKKV